MWLPVLPPNPAVELPFQIDRASGAVLVEGRRGEKPLRVMIALGTGVTRTASTEPFELGGRRIDLRKAFLTDLPAGVDVALGEDLLKGALGRDGAASKYVWWPEGLAAKELEKWTGPGAVPIACDVRPDGTLELGGKIGGGKDRFLLGSGLLRSDFRTDAVTGNWRRLTTTATTDLDGFPSSTEVGMVGPVTLGRMRLPVVFAASSQRPGNRLDLAAFHSARVAVSLASGKMFVAPQTPDAFGASIMGSAMGVRFGTSPSGWTLAEYPAGFPQRFKAEIEGARIRAIAGLDVDEIRRSFLQGSGELEKLGELFPQLTPPFEVEVVTRTGSMQKLRVTG